MVENERPPAPAFPLVLASTSPRRRRLLAEAGVPFEVVPPRDVAEDIPAGEPADELVRRHARAKAASVAADFPGRIILGADTVVVLDGVVYGKPADAADAARMLAGLAGRVHVVFTGLSLIAADGRERNAVEKTGVKIRRLTMEDVAAYVATGEPLDKAGGYAIQGRGAFLVERVNGDYFNVVGLPLIRLADLLAAAGYRLFSWPTP